MSDLMDKPGISRIFLPLRGYPAELRAANLALILAEASGTSVHILNVQKIVDQQKYNFQVIRDLIVFQADKMKINVDVEIVEGLSARDQIQRKLEKERFDLIITGTQRSQGFPYDYRASNTLKLAKSAERDCPLLVVQSKNADFASHKINDSEMKKILFPVVSADEIDDLVARIAKLLKNSMAATAAELLAIKVLGVSSFTAPSFIKRDKALLHTLSEDFLEQMNRYNAMLKPVNLQILVGHKFDRAIAYLAKKEKIDLLLLGVRPPYTPLSLRTRPIWKIARNARSDVVYVFGASGKDVR
ncbi:MAG: universal stress protein [Candidatus Hermodarchaeota archaeon]